MIAGFYIPPPPIHLSRPLHCIDYMTVRETLKSKLIRKKCFVIYFKCLDIVYVCARLFIK